MNDNTTTEAPTGLDLYWVNELDKSLSISRDAALLGVDTDTTVALFDAGFCAGATGADGQRRLLMYAGTDFSGGLLSVFPLYGDTLQQRTGRAWDAITLAPVLRSVAAGAARIAFTRGQEAGFGTIQRGLRALCGAASAADVESLAADLQQLADPERTF